MRATEITLPLLGVLDLETAPEAQAVRLASGGREPMKRGALHRLRAAALLTFGGFTAPRLVVWGEDSDPEDKMLISLDGELRALKIADGALATYGGTRHDLPMLRRRAARHLLAGADGLLCWGQLGWEHVDVMQTWRPPGADPMSLRDLAAGLGIPVDAGVRDRTSGAAEAKAVTDVFATALVYLHHLALEGGSLDPLSNGWSAIAELCERESATKPCLRQFARHETLGMLRSRSRAD